MKHFVQADVRNGGEHLRILSLISSLPAPVWGKNFQILRIVLGKATKYVVAQCLP